MSGEKGQPNVRAGGRARTATARPTRLLAAAAPLLKGPQVPRRGRGSQEDLAAAHDVIPHCSTAGSRGQTAAAGARSAWLILSINTALHATCSRTRAAGKQWHGTPAGLGVTTGNRPWTGLVRPRHSTRHGHLRCRPCRHASRCTRRRGLQSGARSCRAGWSAPFAQPDRAARSQAKAHSRAPRQGVQPGLEVPVQLPCNQWRRARQPRGQVSAPIRA